MLRLNKILGYLPTAIFCWYILLLAFCTSQFYKEIFKTWIELIDFVLCTTMVFHAFYNFKNYTFSNKSSLVSICFGFAFLTLLDRTFKIDNWYYYRIYIGILCLNLVFIYMHKNYKNNIKCLQRRK